MKKFTFTITAIILSVYSVYGEGTVGKSFTTHEDRSSLIYNLTIEGPSSLYTDIGDFYIDNLPSDISWAHWSVTDNNNLSIVEDNGVSGCRIERVPFKSYDIETSSFVDVYLQGEAKLMLEFEWEGEVYTISETITFEDLPRVESNLYSITSHHTSKEILFTNLINPARCNAGRGAVLFIDFKSGATIFQQYYDFCSTFSIATHTIPNGLYIMRLILNGQIIQQNNIWLR
ncbi:MAG: hypothetical protein FWH23_02500 [Bacteroidales bacterium]|nr:hypothetical protein [Bacteroidales bacterium]MCL2133416.1 hypothetical protein [Bacteroidales bacterium]